MTGIPSYLGAYPSDLARQRSLLKHSWLENGLRAKGVRGIVDLWRDETAWDALTSEFPNRVRQAREFGHEFVEGVAPQRLIDEVPPLQELPESVRQQLAGYLSTCAWPAEYAQDLQRRYHQALDRVSEEIDLLTDLWQQPRPQALMQVEACAERLQQAAADLCAVMEHIPAGILVP